MIYLCFITICDSLNVSLVFFVVDDAIKTETNNSAEINRKAASDNDPCKMDGICPEVIKVYIFKADPGDDDLGKVLIFFEKYLNLEVKNQGLLNQTCPLIADTHAYKLSAWNKQNMAKVASVTTELASR